MNEHKISSFFMETKETFHFLEQFYGYQRLENYVKYPNEGRDAVAWSRYVGSHVGIQITWSIIDAVIDVVFVELQQPHVFPAFATSFPGVHPNAAKSINLYTLAEMLFFINESDFLIKDIENTRKWKKHAKIIEEYMHEVITGLAHATQTHAVAILEGDTSIFPKVMNYYLAKLKQRDPEIFIPGLKPQDEPSQE